MGSACLSFLLATISNALGGNVLHCTFYTIVHAVVCSRLTFLVIKARFLVIGFDKVHFLIREFLCLVITKSESPTAEIINTMLENLRN
jgi:hypothetical protein